MKTIEVREITIDLTRSDTRSGSTTLARILFNLFKENGIDVEFDYTGRAIDGLSRKRLKQVYEENYISNENNLKELLQYYKDRKIQITIIPE